MENQQPVQVGKDDVVILIKHNTKTGQQLISAPGNRLQVCSILAVAIQAIATGPSQSAPGNGKAN